MNKEQEKIEVEEAEFLAEEAKFLAEEEAKFLADLRDKPTMTLREWNKDNEAILCDYSMYPEYDYTEPYYTSCWYHCIHCKVGITKESFRHHEYEICKARNNDLYFGYCSLSRYGTRMTCMICNDTNLNVSIRKCDRKLKILAGKENPRIDFTTYCNMRYIPKFKVWICTDCGEPHDYSEEPEKCSNNYGPKACSPAYGNFLDDYDNDNICSHCKTEGINRGLVCKIQDRTECECDECMALYSRFKTRFMRTKSARN